MVIQLNQALFEMDVRGLVMAFFPGEEIQVQIGERQCGEAVESVRSCGVDAAGAAGTACGEDGHILAVTHDEMQMKVVVLKGGQELSREELPVENKDKKLRRDQLKQMVYRVLSQALHRTLPWGTLTGIRPVKMVRTQLEQGVSQAEILRQLDQYYYVNQKKQQLMLEIARTELEALTEIPYKGGYSLYAGIPFCPSTCAYCSFTSYPLKSWESQTDAYVEMLCREIDVTVGLFEEQRLCTAYVGGGTPTTLSPRQLDRLLSKIRQVSERDGLYELTVEAGRPDSVTRQKLQVLKDYGVTRISINPQTMQPKTLETIGRRHTVEQTVEAYALARSMGFDNINMDLIIGLPGETGEDVEDTMEQISALAPDSLTVHSLAIKRAAKLRMFQEDYSQYESVNTQEIMDMIQEYAAQMGLIPYYLYRQKNMAGNFENVGYAKRDKIGIYNILIMEELQTIAAVGAGGSTKLVIPDENRIERVENVKEVRSYLTRFEEMLDRKRTAFEAERAGLR